MAKQNKGRKFFAASATAALVASAIVPVASAAQVNDYNKIQGYAKDAVQALVDAGVIQGDTNGNFNPFNTVTRAQAAEIFTKALELEADGDVNFSDVKKGAWYYNSIAAVVANGIFEGVSANEFAPNKSLTRSEAAKVLVDAFGLEGSESLSQFADASQVKPWAKTALETAVANGIFTGSEENGKLNLKPNAAITRQDFAVVFARTLDLVDTETPVDAAVKAINNTTVEVTFEEEVDNVQALDFKIDGLEIKNAAVKQTNKKVVVLTTAAQTADKEYTVSLGEEKIGSFKGISAVIPAKITLVEDAVQGIVGKQVTLKADIGVKEAGVPVTFNVDNTDDLGKDYVTEVTTDANGIATYSYTQYVAGAHDSVAVYPTGAPATRDVAQVVWGVDTILEITAVEEKDKEKGNTLSNGDSKLYKVTYKDPETGKPVSGQRIDLSFLENINVNPDKLTSAKINGINPHQLSNGTTPVTVEVITNSKGEATFSVSGTNTTATPVAFIENVGTVNNELDQKELRVYAEKLTFTSVQAKYEMKISSKTGQDAATGSSNGRTFQLEVKDEKGKAAAGQTVNVAFDENLDRVISTETEAEFKIDATKGVTGNSKQIAVRLDKDGKGEFTIFSNKVNDYATPVAWIDINDSKAVEGNLDEGEVKVLAEKTYFATPKIVSGKLVVQDSTDKEVKEFKGTDRATFAFSAANQSGKAVAGIPLKVSYTVKNTGSNKVTVVVPGQSDVEVAAGKTATVDYTTTTGENSIEVYSPDNKSTSVEVTANGTTNDNDRVFLGQQTASATFTSTTEVAPTLTGEIVSINTEDKEVKFSGKEPVSYKNATFKNAQGNTLDVDAFEAAILNKTGVIATYTKDSNDKVTIAIIDAGSTGSTPDTSVAVTTDVTFASLNLPSADKAVPANTSVVGAELTATGVKLTAKAVGTTTVAVTEENASGTADDQVATINVTVTENAAGVLVINTTLVPYVTPDTTPPSITGIVYSAGATNTITVTFSEAIDDSASDFATIAKYALSGTAVDAGQTVASVATGATADDNTIVLTLSAALAATGNVTLTVADAGVFKDLAGNPSAANLTGTDADTSN